jgi:hypothetical protein
MSGDWRGTLWTLRITFCIVIIRCTETFWSPCIISTTLSHVKLRNNLVFLKEEKNLQTLWYSTPSTHHLHPGLQLTTSLRQASHSTDWTILTYKYLIITLFTYINITHIIVTQSIISLNCYGVRAIEQTNICIFLILVTSPWRWTQ